MSYFHSLLLISEYRWLNQILIRYSIYVLTFLSLAARFSFSPFSILLGDSETWSRRLKTGSAAAAAAAAHAAVACSGFSHLVSTPSGIINHQLINLITLSIILISTFSISYNNLTRRHRITPVLEKKMCISCTVTVKQQP